MLFNNDNGRSKHNKICIILLVTVILKIRSKATKTTAVAANDTAIAGKLTSKKRQLKGFAINAPAGYITVNTNSSQTRQENVFFMKVLYSLPSIAA